MFKKYLDFYVFYKPKEGWERLVQKDFKLKDLYLFVVVWFSLLPPMGHFLGFTVFKGQYITSIQSFLEIAKKDPEQSPKTVEYMEALLRALTDNSLNAEIMIAIVTWIFEIFKPLVLAGIIFFLAGAFKGTKDFDRAFLVAVYSLIPTWIAGIFYIINSPLTMIVLFSASFYSFYLIFTAAESVLKIPTEKSKHFQFIILVILLYLVISGFIGQLETNITYSLLINATQ